MSSDGAIKTERLLIEELRTEHASEFFESLSNERLYQYIEPPAPNSVGQLSARFARFAAGSGGVELWKNWNMWLALDRTPVGTLQATIVGAEAAIAYIVFQQFWRRGYGAEGVSWLLGELQQHFGITLAKASVDTENEPSIRLLSSLGFELVETRDGAERIRGELRDEYWFAKRLVD